MAPVDDLHAHTLLDAMPALKCPDSSGVLLPRFSDPFPFQIDHYRPVI